MGSLSTEKRLELLRNIREDHGRNQVQLRQREHLVYELPEEQEDSENKTGIFAHLKFRLGLSALLLGCFFYLKDTGGNAFGISMDQVQSYIAMEEFGEVVENVAKLFEE